MSASAGWHTPGDRSGLANVDLTVTVSERAEAVRPELVAELEHTVAARSRANPVVHLSLEGR